MANPVYPAQTISNNLGLQLTGMDEAIALDFLIVDTAFGIISLGGVSVVTVTTNATASAGTLILVNTASGPVTITLPLASLNSGKQITIKKVSSDGNAVIVSRSGGDLIDGQISQSFAGQYTSLSVVSDGQLAWYIT